MKVRNSVQTFRLDRKNLQNTPKIYNKKRGKKILFIYAHSKYRSLHLIHDFVELNYNDCI